MGSGSGPDALHLQWPRRGHLGDSGFQELLLSGSWGRWGLHWDLSNNRRNANHHLWVLQKTQSSQAVLGLSGGKSPLCLTSGVSGPWGPLPDPPGDRVLPPLCIYFLMLCLRPCRAVLSPLEELGEGLAPPFPAPPTQRPAPFHNQRSGSYCAS